MAGEWNGQGRNGRWVESANELVVEEEASWRVAQGKLVELLGWERIEGWWPRLVSGRQRSQEHTDSPSKPCQEQGYLGKVRGEEREKTVKLPIPNFNGNSGIGTEGVDFLSWYPELYIGYHWSSLPLFLSLIFYLFLFSLFFLLSLSPPIHPPSSPSIWPIRPPPCWRVTWCHHNSKSSIYQYRKL